MLFRLFAGMKGLPPVASNLVSHRYGKGKYARGRIGLHQGRCGAVRFRQIIRVTLSSGAGAQISHGIPAPQAQASARALKSAYGRWGWFSQTQPVSSQTGHFLVADII
jgi:hypothetical protein